MANPNEELLGAITILDKDFSGTVNVSNAVLTNTSSVIFNSRNISPIASGQSSIWVSDGYVPMFTDGYGVTNPIYIGTGSGTGDVVGPNSSIDTEIVRYDGSTGKVIQSGGSAKLTATGGLSVGIDGYFASGSSPATTGPIRLSNNTGIFSRNAAGNTNIQIVRIDNNNDLTLGASGVQNNRIVSGINIILNATGSDVVSVNSLNTTFNYGADVIIGNGLINFESRGSTPAITDGGAFWVDSNNDPMFTTSSGTIVLGAGGGSGDITGPEESIDDEIVRYNGTTGKVIKNSGSATLSSTGGLALGSAGFISTGPNPSGTGQIRLTNNQSIWSKTSGGNDVHLLSLDGTNNIIFGNIAVSNVDVRSSTSVKTTINGTERVSVSQNSTVFQHGTNITIGAGVAIFNSRTTPSGTAGAGTFWVENTSPTLPKFTNSNGDTITLGAGGTGDVSGPEDSIDNEIVRYDGVTGKVIKNSGSATLTATGGLSVGTDGYFAAGSSPPTNGGIRLSNNISIYSRTTGSVNIELIGLNSSNVIGIGHLSNVPNINLKSSDHTDITVGASGYLRVLSGETIIHHGAYEVSINDGYINHEGRTTNPGTPGAGRGLIWINAGVSPTKPMFTDSSGTSYSISLGDGYGDVIGPEGGTEEDEVVRFADTSGKLLKSGGVAKLTNTGVFTLGVDGYISSGVSSLTKTGGLNIGDGYVAIGTILPPYGSIRLGNNRWIQSTSSSGIGSFTIAGINSSNNIVFGSTGVNSQIDNFNAFSINLSSTERFSLSTTRVSFKYGADEVHIGNGYISIGNTPATSGSLRLKANTNINYLTTSGNANLIGNSLSGSNYTITIGSVATAGNNDLILNSRDSFSFNTVSGTQRMKLDTNDLYLNLATVGGYMTPPSGANYFFNYNVGGGTLCVSSVNCVQTVIPVYIP
ncbi:MAG: hypothetical protein WC942_04635 [Clostridia bacterium]|jgi:hypothetical protein